MLEDQDVDVQRKDGQRVAASKSTQGSQRRSPDYLRALPNWVSSAMSKAVDVAAHDSQLDPKGR